MKAPEPPSGELWLHEIKHDGFRVIARKDGLKVRLYSRPGNDLTYRFPLIVESLARLRSRSCILDGEAVCCGDDGVPRFDRIRYRRYDASVLGDRPRSTANQVRNSSASMGNPVVTARAPPVVPER